MENKLNILSSRAGFNTALRHFRSVTSYVSEIAGGANLADLVNESLDEKEIDRFQVRSILNALLLDKLSYRFKSHNLETSIENADNVISSVSKWGKELIRPTRIYTKTILHLMKKVKIKALSHITGGGFYDNIPRVLPKGIKARISSGSWPVPSIFQEIQRRGHIEQSEMFRTFNMGVGMVMVLDPRSTRRALALSAELGQKAWVIGELAVGETSVEIS